MAKVDAMPPRERLCELLDYDPATGALTWKPRDGDPKFNNRNAGKPALTCRTPHGYLRGTIKAKHFYAHRVAWKMVNGDEPPTIDHINGDRTDNRLSNIRGCDNADNQRNQGISKLNKSGHSGVYWNERYRAWQVTCASKYFGRYPRLEDAIEARRCAETKLGFHPNHGKRESFSAAGSPSSNHRSK